MLEITAESNLRKLQDYIREVEKARGFDQESVLQKCLLLGEEIGELFKAVRSVSGMSIGTTSQVPCVAEEVADVLCFLLAIANRLEIDVMSAFIEKEKINASRQWA